MSERKNQSPPPSDNGTGGTAGASQRPDALKDAIERERNVIGGFVRATVQHRQAMVPDDPEFASSWPAIWAWLTTDMSEGYIKTRGRLQARCDGAAWLVTLSDQSLKQSTQAPGLTLRDALDKLEANLHRADCLWSKYRTPAKLHKPAKPET